MKRSVCLPDLKRNLQAWQLPTLWASHSAARPWLRLLNMWGASGSLLFPDRLLQKLHGRGLAKSTICWISLCLSPSSYVFTLFSCLFCHFVTNTDKLHCLHKKSFWLVRKESSENDDQSFFFQNICYQRSSGMPQSLVRGPAFLAISRMI